VAVVLDIKLPGMSGWEILHALKSDPDIAGTPVVIVSVLPERGKGFALGAADYLVKPVDQDDLVHSVRGSWPTRPACRGRTIVVVDDDPMALELVRVTLEPQGWSVRVCERGRRRRRARLVDQPSVVLVDLLMPETDGFAVIDALAGRPETADIPVVVLTAKSLDAATASGSTGGSSSSPRSRRWTSTSSPSVSSGCPAPRRPGVVTERSSWSRTTTRTSSSPDVLEYAGSPSSVATTGEDA
jgi:CheY-like chemotaxis protein